MSHLYFGFYAHTFLFTYIYKRFYFYVIFLLCECDIVFFFHYLNMASLLSNNILLDKNNPFQPIISQPTRQKQLFIHSNEL